MSAACSPPPPIRSAAPTPLACPRASLSREGKGTLFSATRTPGPALRASPHALPRRLQFLPTAARRPFASD
jgi:hypothetical protein